MATGTGGGGSKCSGESWLGCRKQFFFHFFCCMSELFSLGFWFIAKKPFSQWCQAKVYMSLSLSLSINYHPNWRRSPETRLLEASLAQSAPRQTGMPRQTPACLLSCFHVETDIIGHDLELSTHGQYAESDACQRRLVIKISWSAGRPLPLTCSFMIWVWELCIQCAFFLDQSVG